MPDAVSFEVPRRAILVVGSRVYPATKEACVRRLVRAALTAPGRHACLLSGGADGPQTWAEREARLCGVHVARIDPLWQDYGERAGFIRSEWLVHFADAVLGWWNGSSLGTAYELACAARYEIDGAPLRVVVRDQDGVLFAPERLRLCVEAALQRAAGRLRQR